MTSRDLEEAWSDARHSFDRVSHFPLGRHDWVAEGRQEKLGISNGNLFPQFTDTRVKSSRSALHFKDVLTFSAHSQSR